MNDTRSPYQKYSPTDSWQTPQSGWGSIQTAAQASLEERTGFIRKVYALFFVGIFFAIAGVFVGFAVPELMSAIVYHPFIALLVMIGGVYGAQAVRHQPVLNVAALFGFIYAGVMPLYAVLARENFPLKMMGTVIGGTAMAGSLGMATGPIAGGLIYDAFAGYAWLYIGAWGMGIGAFLMAMGFRPFPKTEGAPVPASA